MVRVGLWNKFLRTAYIRKINMTSTEYSERNNITTTHEPERRSLDTDRAFLRALPTPAPERSDTVKEV